MSLDGCRRLKTSMKAVDGEHDKPLLARIVAGGL
jgi:hypothetical protein